MAKTIAPLLSFDAGGQVAKTQVYSRWRGIPYVRRYVVPSNPNTTGQQEVRNIFSTMNVAWKLAPALLTAPWELFATSQPFVGRNAFIGKNIAVLQGQTDMQAFIASPGAKGGTPPDAIAATGAVGQITVAFTDGVEPTGWTLEGHVAAAFIDQAPDAIFPGPIVADVETTVPPTDVVLTGLDAGSYVVTAWNRWTRPDGTTAYSVSLNDTATVT